MTRAVTAPSTRPPMLTVTAWFATSKSPFSVPTMTTGSSAVSEPLMLMPLPIVVAIAEEVRGLTVATEYLQVLQIYRPGVDEICMLQLQLAGDAPELVVLEHHNRRVRRRQLEEAVEQRQPLLAGGEGGELARHEKVFRAAVPQTVRGRD